MAKNTTPRKKKTPVPADETKAAKFSRLAGARVSKALKAIKNIGNLSSRAGYDYTEAQVEKIAGALADTLDATIKRFSTAAPTATEETFTV